MAQPNNILSGKGCANCRNLQTSRRCRKSHAQFISEMSCIDDSIIVLGSYVTAKTPILCQCAVCGHQWSPTPSNLLSGYGCAICKHKQIGLKKRKAHEQFVKEIYELNSYLSVKNEYIDAKTPILIHCKRCGADFVRTPDALLSNHGYCAGCMGSRGEQRISQWLTQHNICFESQKRFNDLKGPGGGYLSYDFYIPSKNLLIEYQGEYHDGNGLYQTDQAYHRQVLHDNIKAHYAQEHQIDLLTIWYYHLHHIPSILEKYFTHIP